MLRESDSREEGRRGDLGNLAGHARRMEMSNSEVGDLDAQ